MAYSIDISNNRFKHITSEDGLSTSQVDSILKSTNGYYWFGTQNGLNRYDGYDIKVYKHDENNKNSISNNFIVDMIEDTKGNLWIATGKGLNKYDLTANKFSHYYEDDTNRSLSHNVVYSLLIDNDKLWIGTRNGLDRLDLTTGSIINKFKGARLHDIIINHEYLWIVSNIGLLRFNKNTEQIINFNGSFDSDYFIKIIKNKNKLWLTTINGLLPFNLLTQQFDNNRTLLPNTIIKTTVADKLNNLWIGTARSGLHYHSINHKYISKIPSNRIDPFHLQPDHISKLIIDGDDLWVGSNNGVSHTSLKGQVQYLRFGNNEIINNHVNNIEQNESNGLWIGTERGVSYYTKEGSNHYEISAVIKILNTNSLVWAIGSKGLFQYNKDNNIFEIIHTVGNIKMEKGALHDIFELAEDKLLLSIDQGLVVWNQKKDTSHILKFSDDITVSSINHITTMSRYKDIILLGAYPGFYFIQTDSKSMERYLRSEELTLLDKSVVYDLIVDKNDVLWIATNNGLFKVKNREIISHYTRKDGLPDNSIAPVIIVENVLWIGSDVGIAAFKVDNNHFEKIHLNNEQFDIEFNNEGVHLGHDGLLYFSSTQGVFYFNPKDFTESAPAPKTTITDFHLFNRPVQASSHLLPKTIRHTKQLTLNHNQNMLTFKFSSMNIKQPNHLYAYQLQGLNHHDEWLITDAKNRRATFTPGPGEYTFRVKSGWDKNTWSDQIAEVKVTILPPW